MLLNHHRGKLCAYQDGLIGSGHTDNVIRDRRTLIKPTEPKAPNPKASGAGVRDIVDEGDASLLPWLATPAWCDDPP